MRLSQIIGIKDSGIFFYTQVENHFKSLNFLSFKLFCAPRESEKFWRKQHFIQFPQVIYSESDLTFYKPFIKTAKPNQNINDENVLELWNREPYLVTPNNKPNWSWNIDENGSPENTIFFPCHYDWKLCWRKSKKIIKEGKIKYFEQGGERIEFSGFLYITNLISI